MHLTNYKEQNPTGYGAVPVDKLLYLTTAPTLHPSEQQGSNTYSSSHIAGGKSLNVQIIHSYYH